MKSRLTEDKISELIREIEGKYESELTKMGKLSGRRGTAGMIRQSKGDLVEWIVSHVLTAIVDLYPDQSVEARVVSGSTDKQTLKSPNGEYEHAQDIHLYVGNNLILSVETKSYTESAMYKRVCEDARLMKKYVNPNMKCILVELEDARNPESQIFMDEEYGTVSSIFTLTDGKRSSAKPIHKDEFRKSLNKTSLKDFIVSMDKFYCDALGN